MINKIIVTMIFKQLVSSFLLCMTFLVMALGITGSHPSNETDLQALIVFKNSIMDDPLNVLSSWNTSAHFCKWEGVTCGALHHRVIELNLMSRHLTGYLPPHIGNLSFLRTIDLRVNNFQGSIPQEITRLARLVRFSLGNNSFQGYIPRNLSRCSNLAYMNLQYNDLEGEIPSDLGSLASLIGLGLSINHFIGEIPTSFGNLTNLQGLYLAHNNLEKEIPRSLGHLTNLIGLQLFDNHLSGLIPVSLFNLSSLSLFSLAYNNFEGSFPEDLGLKLPNLQGLYLGMNQFHGLIPPSLANATELVQIDMTLNSFSGPLPKHFGKLYMLQYVNFDSNFLGGNVEDFILSLSNCSKLNIIELRSNPFGGQFPNSIANLSTTLQGLALDNASLTGSIPHEIGQLKNLQYLYISGNALTGSIPNTIGYLSDLEEFYFYGNKFSGEIPSSIGNLTKLSILAGAFNKLEGIIPPSFGNCTSLQIFDLGFNKLSGPIPKQLFGITYLSQGLFLDNNFFSGTLPMEIGNLENLEVFNITNNNLSGTIPDTLGYCKVLQQIYLRGNSFNGSVPESFSKLKSVRVLDLSYNHLSGTIPSLLTGLSLERLNLSYNLFYGEVPNQGIFKNVSNFSVSGNKNLCGGIKELNLTPCPIKDLSRKLRKPTNLRVVVPLATSLPIFTLLLLLLAIVNYIRRSKRGVSSLSIMQEKYPKLSYAELSIATGHFSSSNLVGEGKHGSVYRGTLNVTNEIVAVKVLKLQQVGANKSFLAECEAMRFIRHRNLVKLITSCSSIDFKGQNFKALIYEFMLNGSLDSWLHPRDLCEDIKILSLIKRLNIAIDMATALDYLHNHCEPAVVHCDLKPSNILLNEDFSAGVSDFGLAKILYAASGVSDPESNTILIRGTIGYVAPEYGVNLEASKAGDMYSYGILLLEMFTGKRPTNSLCIENTNLHEYVQLNIQNQAMEIADPRILQEGEAEASRNPYTISKMAICLGSVLEIGLLCSKEHARERMDAQNALVELLKIRNSYLS